MGAVWPDSLVSTAAASPEERRALTRKTSMVSSFTGPSRTWTTSPTSKRRTVLPSLIPMPCVKATSFTTFIRTIKMASRTALETAPALSSSLNGGVPPPAACPHWHPLPNPHLYPCPHPHP